MERSPQKSWEIEKDKEEEGETYKSGVASPFLCALLFLQVKNQPALATRATMVVAVIPAT